LQLAVSVKWANTQHTMLAQFNTQINPLGWLSFSWLVHCRSQRADCSLYKAKDWKNTFSQAGVESYSGVVTAQSQRSHNSFKGQSAFSCLARACCYVVCCIMVWFSNLKFCLMTGTFIHIMANNVQRMYHWTESVVKPGCSW